MKALVLIKFASLESREAYHQLCRLKPVTESYMVYGRYDAVLMLQGKNIEEIHDILLSGVQPVPGVTEVLPCIVVENGASVEEKNLVPSLRAERSNPLHETEIASSGRTPSSQ